MVRAGESAHGHISTDRGAGCSTGSAAECGSSLSGQVAAQHGSGHGSGNATRGATAAVGGSGMGESEVCGSAEEVNSTGVSDSVRATVKPEGDISMKEKQGLVNVESKAQVTSPAVQPVVDSCDVKLGEEATQVFPNPHAELMNKGGFIPTRDEQSALNGNVQATKPGSFNFSKKFSCSNVSTMYGMLDELAKYYGERWQGFGHPLFLRATSQLWETHKKFRVVRDEKTRKELKQSFRSIDTSFIDIAIAIPI